MHTFVPNKPFGSLLEIAPTKFIPLKTFISEFSYIKVWFTDQNSQPLEIAKNLSNKYCKKLLDSAKKSGATKVATDATKNTSKRALQKNSRSNW